MSPNMARSRIKFPWRAPDGTSLCYVEVSGLRGASMVAQMVKILPAVLEMQEAWVRSLWSRGLENKTMSLNTLPHPESTDCRIAFVNHLRVTFLGNHCS